MSVLLFCKFTKKYPEIKYNNVVIFFIFFIIFVWFTKMIAIDI